MKYKRILAAMTAVGMLLCGCSEVKNSNSENVSNENPHGESAVPVVEEQLTTIATKEEIPMPEGVYWLSNLSPTENGFIGSTLGDDSDDFSNETHVYRYNTDTSEWSETVLVQLAPYDGYYDCGSLTTFGDDAYYSLVIMENHSNMEPFSSKDEDYDFDLYNESWVSDYYLCTYTTDGTLGEKLKIEGLEEYEDQQGYDRFASLYCDGENSYVSLSDGTILRIEQDGTLTETVSPEDSRWQDRGSNYFLFDRDGKPVFYQRRSQVDDNMHTSAISSLFDFDVSSGRPAEPFYTFNNSIPVTQAVHSGGCGDYRMFVTESEEEAGRQKDKLYGIRDDGTKELVIDWDASNMVGMEVVPLQDGTFVGSDGDKLYRITRKFASEIKEKQIVTIGVLGGVFHINDFVREFNDSQEDYQLEISVYTLDNLKLDVVSNNAPDLIYMNGDSNDYHDTFLRLGSRGVFCDLYELMENDPEINRDTLVSNILTAMEHPNGSLYSLTRGFYVESIAVKSKFTDKENWTMDDMIALYEGADDMKYYWSTKQETLRMLMIGTDFTDELNGTCSFNSPEFIKMLEFCDRYPLNSTCPEKNYDDPAQMEKMNQWFLDNYQKYQHDNDYLYYASLSAFVGNTAASRYAYIKAELGGDFTFAGYPSDNGKGGKITADGEIAITTNCSDKDAAWEVLKAYLHDTSHPYEYIGYSVIDETFEEQLDNEMYIMDFGGRRSNKESYFNGGSGELIYPLTQEERDGLEEYIRSCDTYMMLDEKVEAIVYEEADVYFNGGRSAEDTAKMIQNRAEIYLSEQS